MKRLLCTLIVLSLVFSLAAPGLANQEMDGENASQSSEESSDTEPESAEELVQAGDEEALQDGEEVTPETPETDGLEQKDAEISRKSLDSVDLRASDIAVLNDMIALQIATEPALAGVDESNVYVGAEIPSYTYENGELTRSSSAKYYPVLEGDEAIGIFMVHNPGKSNQTYSFGQEWKDAYNTYLSGDEEYGYIAITEGRLFLGTESGVELLAEDHAVLQANARSYGADEAVEAGQIQEADSGDLTYHRGDVSTKKLSPNPQWVIDEIESGETITVGEDEANIQQPDTFAQARAELPGVYPPISSYKNPKNQVTAATSSVYFKDFPYYTHAQDYEYCWAICLYSTYLWYAGEYTTWGGVEAPLAICQYTGVPYIGKDAGATVLQLKNFYPDLYKIPVSVYTSRLSANDILAHMKKGRPLNMIFRGGKYAHNVVTINFVQRPNSSEYKHMLTIADSNWGGTAVISATATGTNFIYKYLELTYTWSETVVPTLF